MADPLFSDIWYRVADIKISLRAEIRIHRHHYRGNLWYIVQDTASGRYHRMNAAAYAFVGLLDGARTVDAAWQAAVDRLADDAPTQPQVISLLARLYGIDLLRGDFTPNALELFSRTRRASRERWMSGLLSPLAWRIPLFAPKRLIDLALPLVSGLRGFPGWLLWIVVVVPAAALAGLNWQELTHDVVNRTMAPHNLLVMALIYPVIKGLHELAHGVSTRVRGGEVHEAGLMFLVFMPVPYVDASSASTFPDKGDRMAVGAAGVATELFFAALALYVWLSVEPGLVSLIAYDTMLIAGVSTLLFNGNPLMRFDSYYVLSDAIEIPNLAQRANRYYVYLLQRYVLGIANSNSPLTTASERKWFVGYGALAFAYRIFITFTIVLGVAQFSVIAGAMIGAWSLLGIIVLPLFRGIKYLFTSPAVGRRRGRAIVTTMVLLIAGAYAVIFVPAPLYTRAEGIVRVPDDAWIRAGAEGIATQVHVANGSHVETGDSIAMLDNPILEAEVKILRARLTELRTKLAAVMYTDIMQAEAIRSDITSEKKKLALAESRHADLQVRAPAAGRYIYSDERDFLGRYFTRGDVIGYVVDDRKPHVRVVIEQKNLALVREQTRAVQVKLATNLLQTFDATVVLQVPGADNSLPSASLGLSGGGNIAIDPMDQQGTTSLESSFKFDLQLPKQNSHPPLGSRAYVRFDHGYETLGARWYRAIRQLLLTRLAV